MENIVVPTPIGNMKLTEYRGYLSTATFTEEQEKSDTNSEVLNHAIKQLAEYFKGTRKEFDLPMLLGYSDFSTKVYKACVQIPYGTRMTYSDLAMNADVGNSTRALATSLAKNDLLIFIPCHRVIPASGGIGNYNAGEHRKKFLLDFEHNNERQINMKVQELLRRSKE